MKQQHESYVFSAFLITLAIAFAMFLISQDAGVITGLTIVEDNANTVNASSTGLRQFIVFINGSLLNPTQNYTGNLTVLFIDNITTPGSIFTTFVNLSEFIFNFTGNVLNLTPLLIEKQPGAVSIRNLTLSAPGAINKSMFVEKQSLYVCVKDMGNATISSFHENCSSTNERVVRCNSTVQSGYICDVLGIGGSELRVRNVTNTSVRSLPFQLTPSEIGEGANFTINITGQDFGNISNVTTDIPGGHLVKHAFSIRNNTFLNLTVAVRYNATLGFFNITLWNDTVPYRIHEDVLRVVAILNVTDALITPVITDIGVNTLFNITFLIGTGVNISTLNSSIANITLNNSDTFIVINATNLTTGTLSNTSIVTSYRTFFARLPRSGTYTIRVTGNLTQSSPPCPGNCLKNATNTQLRRLVFAGEDAALGCTSASFTDASQTATVSTINFTSNTAVVTGALKETSTCNVGDTLLLGIIIGGVSGSPIARTNEIPYPRCNGVIGTPVAAEFDGEFLSGSVTLTVASSLGKPFRLEYIDCTTTTAISRLPPGVIVKSGGRRALDFACRKNMVKNEQGVQFYGIKAGLSGWHACAESTYWQAFAGRNTSVTRLISQAYAACCQAQTRR